MALGRREGLGLGVGKGLLIGVLKWRGVAVAENATLGRN
jgi:hypothetical protein